MNDCRSLHPPAQPAGAHGGVCFGWPQAELVRDLETLRREAPLVHCHSNSVAAGFMANVLLAVGASPTMVASQAEIVEFAGIARAILLSVASVTEERGAALLRSAVAANDAQRPWVLDPVAFGVLQFRSQIVSQLLPYRPTVIKGNASEILALAGRNGHARGADSTEDSSTAIPSAFELARRTGSIVAVTGAVDFVTDGTRLAEIPGGHPLMARVTGTGCALGALIAAFLGAGVPAFDAAVAACAVFAASGIQAGARCHGPGSFAPLFLDALWQLGNEPAPV